MDNCTLVSEDQSDYSASSFRSLVCCCCCCYSHSRIIWKKKLCCCCKCQTSRMSYGEQHWSKLYQATCSSTSHLNSQKIRPVAALSRALGQLLKWFSPSGKSARNQSSGQDSPSHETLGDKPNGFRLCMCRRVSRCTHAQPTSSAKDDDDYLIAKDKLVTSILADRMILRVEHPARIGKIAEYYPHTPASTATNRHEHHNVIRHDKTLLLTVDGQPHAPLTYTVSCPSNHSRRTTTRERMDKLTATWPPLHYEFTHAELCDEGDDSALLMDDTTDAMQDTSTARSSADMQEFTISFDDLQLDTCLSKINFIHTYKGRWHGNVIIQIFDNLDEVSCATFWQEVRILSKIRHENIALFMGACVEPTHLALVTADCSGTSLYDKMHIKREKITPMLRHNFAHQVAQGLAYLHAKQIVYKRVNSRNVFVERYRAKLSVIDIACTVSGPKADHIMKGHIPYFAPELLGYPLPSNIITSDLPFTEAADVFAFGILLHELFSGSIPYDSIPVDALVYQVQAGRRPSLDIVSCPLSLKNLIKQSWSRDPILRPSSLELAKELQNKNVTLHKRYSSSEPERLHAVKSAALLS